MLSYGIYYNGLRLSQSGNEYFNPYKWFSWIFRALTIVWGFLIATFEFLGG